MKDHSSAAARKSPSVVVPLRKGNQAPEATEDDGDFGSLFNFFDNMLNLCDESVLSAHAGSKITITITEEGWCLEAKDTEEE